MTQEDRDLPAKVDAVLSGILAFAYRLIGTLFSCLIHPRVGPLRAYVRRSRSPGPTTALAAAAALVALSSLALPVVLPDLVVRDERQVLRFLVFASVLYIAFDAVLLFCAHVFEPYSAKRRARALGMLRYSASALLLAWFLSAIVIVLPQVSPASGVGMFAKPVADLLKMSLVSVTIGGVAAAPLFFSVASVTRRQWQSRVLRKLQLFLACAALAGFMLLLNSYGPRASYPIVEFLAGKAGRQSPSSMAVSKPPEAFIPTLETGTGEVVADPVICRVSSNGDAQVELAFLNRSGQPTAIDLSGLTLKVSAIGWTLLDPKTVEGPLKASSQIMVVLNGNEGKALLLSGSLDLKMGLPDLVKGWCDLGFPRAKVRTVNARLESVVDASQR